MIDVTVSPPPVAQLRDPTGRVTFTLHAHIALGRGARKTTWRNEQLGLTRVDCKASERDPWRTTFLADAANDQEFQTLRAAMQAAARGSLQAER